MSLLICTYLYDPHPFYECDLPNKTIYRICYHISNTTGATCGLGSAYPFGSPEIIPSFWWGLCCLLCFLCCVMCTIVCLFVFFIFSHGVVSLFAIYEFDCPFGIVRPSFRIQN